MARYDNLDYTGFSFSFLKRRLDYVFNELRIRKLAQFTERLPDEVFRDNVRYYMAVNVTEMFRDPGFWRSMRTNVFPLLEEDIKTFWFPDTSSGEEVFSLVILLHEYGWIDEADIVCNHLSSEKCREVSSGIFDSGNMELHLGNYRRLEERDTFDDYFFRDNNRLRLRNELLKNVRISSGWLIPDNEIESFGFIMFRNSCINYTFQYRERVLEEIVSRLKPGGFIALGIKESVPSVLKDILVPVDKKESIYRKTGVKSS